MRRRRAEKKELIPDGKYNSQLVARLINTIMKSGKKSTAQRIVYSAFDIVKTKRGDIDPLEFFLQALENVKPKLEVKSRRVGGATYQVPMEVPSKRQVALGLRWIVDYSSGKKGKPMHDSLAQELIDAYDKTGSSVKKRDELHKMAQANKAFAHFRW